jgi:F0F1-type ATP synthase beta subunit
MKVCSRDYLVAPGEKVDLARRPTMKKGAPGGTATFREAGVVTSVRGIALTPTQGLGRGMMVENTGAPLKAPVGRGILSRMFDVFGNVIDRGEALSDVEWRSVHRAPPSLDRRSTKSEIFETGIKVIDVLFPSPGDWPIR